MFLPQRLYGVTGWPLGQSLSPLVHNTGFQVLGLPAVYLAWPIRPELLRDFVSAVRTLPVSGCSVTIPHKIAIMPLLDQVDNSATRAGAVNTLYFEDGRLCGANTDVAGFLAPLANLDLAGMSVLVLGAGGASHAVAAGLIARGCLNAEATSPHDQSQFKLCERFGLTPLLWAERYARPYDLVINATPLGMSGKFAAENPYDFARYPGPGYAYDLIYNPLLTPFLKSAQTAGRECISGMRMFFSQADAQFRLWTGQGLPEESRLALAQALGHTA